MFVLSTNRVERVELDSFLTDAEELKSLKSIKVARKGIRSGAQSPTHPPIMMRSLFSKQNSLRFDSLTPTLNENRNKLNSDSDLDFRTSKLEKLLGKFRSLQTNSKSQEEIFKDSFVDMEYFDELVKTKDYTQILECLLGFVTHSSRLVDNSSGSPNQQRADSPNLSSSKQFEEIQVFNDFTVKDEQTIEEESSIGSIETEMDDVDTTPRVPPYVSPSMNKLMNPGEIKTKPTIEKKKRLGDIKGKNVSTLFGSVGTIQREARTFKKTGKRVK